MLRSKLWVLITLSFLVAAARPVQAADVHPLVVDAMVVSVIDSADVPATLPGVIGELTAREGTAVARGQRLARLDDAEAKIVYQRALADAEIADELAAATTSGELAARDLALARQAVAKQSLQRRIADLKAASDLRVQAAEKAMRVAENELNRAMQARSRFAESVSQSEIDGLSLAHQRASLEAQQAEFERSVDALTAEIEAETAAGFATALERAELEGTLAKFEQKILSLRARATQSDVAQSRLLLQRHQISSPLQGVVVEVFGNVGQWVQTGDPICRVVRLDRLRAEGFLPLSQAIRLRSAAETAEFLLQAAATPQKTSDLEAEPMVQRHGKLVFISPEVDAINHEVRFWVEFENSDLAILPGMKMTLQIRFAQP